MLGIVQVVSTIHRLKFSTDGRYLAAGTGYGLHIFDRDRQWAEVFRDTSYGVVIGVTFAADGRLATATYDGMVRLYDRNFEAVVPPRKTAWNKLFSIVFSPDGSKLAVGYEDVPIVDLLDGHSLAPLPGPNVDSLGNGGLGAVMWSKDGKTLYAGGRYNDGHGGPVLAWADSGRGERHALPAGSNTIMALAALPDGDLLVAAADPFLVF